MRARLALAVIVAAFVPQAASASCAAPEWDVDNDRAQTGESITISGRFFIDGCNDTGSASWCGGPAPQEPEVPMTGIRFQLLGGDESVDAVTVSADEQGDVAATLTVPQDAKAGAYKVVATYFGQGQEAVPVRVTAD